VNFGGPAGQIAMLHRDLVERRRWIDEGRFLHALNYCMLLPGPEAQQLATYVGWSLHGVRGGLAAGLLFVGPSIGILAALSWAYVALGHLPLVAGALDGIKPVVLALVAEAMVRIARRAFRRPIHGALAAVSFVALWFFALPFPLAVAGALALGIVGSRFLPGIFSIPSEEAPPSSGAAASAWRGSLKIAAGALALWFLPLAALDLQVGELPRLREIYLFFTQAAFVTFGGAYAVLAYVGQVAVETFGWLQPGQMIDGLALAETTPGPLIMVLQFVGFLAGHGAGGPLDPWVSAALGAALTTWATFLPSTALILIGAPYVERLRSIRSLQAGMVCVTAAVVGVIADLGLNFARTTLFASGHLDLIALALALAAWVALDRFKVDAPWVILAGALVGLARGSV
jgi:chromate transporter